MPLIEYFKEMGAPINPLRFKYYIEDYTEEFENPVKKTAKFFFTVKSFRCEEAERGSTLSGIVEKLNVYKLRDGLEIIRKQMLNIP